MGRIISWVSRILLGSAGTFRRGLTLLLAVALVGTETGTIFAQAPQATDPAFVESQVKKFGVGKSVKVKLADGEQIRGHIRAIGPDSFTVKVSRATERSIPYAQVTEIKDPGPITWIIVGAAIVVVTILVIRR